VVGVFASALAGAARAVINPRQRQGDRSPLLLLLLLLLRAPSSGGAAGTARLYLNALRHSRSIYMQSAFIIVITVL
jgi:hypothetical protein